MKATVRSGSPQRSGWSVHRVVLAVLAGVGAALSLLIWFHPTLGYGTPGSILAGEDLRSIVMLILWGLLATFAVAGSLALVVGSRLTERKLPVLLVSYAVAVGVVPLALLVIDKYV